MVRQRWTVADIPSQAGRRAVVTGASAGLGFETARALAGIEAINRLTTATTEAAPQHLDLVFGRGAHARA